MKITHRDELQEEEMGILRGSRLLFLTHERSARVKNLGTIRWIFIHHTTIPEFLNKTFLPLNIGIRNIADFVRMETIPTINIRPNGVHQNTAEGPANGGEGAGGGTISFRRGLWRKE
jgi:hypothetical protein